MGEAAKRLYGISDGRPWGRVGQVGRVGYGAWLWRGYYARVRSIMDELVNLIVQKTGISQDDAQKAVQVVVNTLKSRLPGPIAAELDSYLTGGSGGAVNALEAEAGTLLKGELGGLLGKL